jgi:hypothetical protein
VIVVKEYLQMASYTQTSRVQINEAVVVQHRKGNTTSVVKRKGAFVKNQNI